MTSNPLLVVGVMVILGVAMNVLRFWTFLSGGATVRRARLERINEHDAHLSFDERIAERLRELQKDQPGPDSPPVHTAGPTGASQGFGRRQA